MALVSNTEEGVSDSETVCEQMLRLHVLQVLNQLVLMFLIS